MENDMHNAYTNTLMAELSNWNKLENTFKEQFSADSVKDRDYLKMKLKEYDRLWHRYKGTAETTDEKALLKMLQFQRQKLEKKLYPTIFKRFRKRTADYIKSSISNEWKKLKERLAPKQEPIYYNEQIIGHATQSNYEQLSQVSSGTSQANRHRNSPDLGRRRKPRVRNGPRPQS